MSDLRIEIVPGPPALNDAEILAGQLVWALDQILRYADIPDAAKHLQLEDARWLAIECRGLVQQARGEEVMPTQPAQNKTRGEVQ